jgi:hypothetical protein
VSRRSLEVIFLIGVFILVALWPALSGSLLKSCAVQRLLGQPHIERLAPACRVRQGGESGEVD